MTGICTDTEGKSGCYNGRERFTDTKQKPEEQTGKRPRTKLHTAEARREIMQCRMGIWGLNAVMRNTAARICAHGAKGKAGATYISVKEQRSERLKVLE
jgi:hypothetical protein